MAHYDDSIPQPTAAKNLKIIVHIGFALTGVVTTLAGAILPTLAQRWGLDDAQAGYLLAAQNIGGLSTTIVVGQVIKRLGIRRSLMVSFALMALGIAGINLTTFAIGMVSVFCSGLGLGIAIPASNMLVAELSSARRAGALNVLNFVWCIGAVTGTPMVSFFVHRVSPLAPLLSLTALLALVGACFSPSKLGIEIADKRPTANLSQSGLSRLQSRAALVICAFAFLVAATFMASVNTNHFHESEGEEQKSHSQTDAWRRIAPHHDA